MKLIIGLGNPGERYEHTRHNIGFMILDRFAKEQSSLGNFSWKEEKKMKALMAEGVRDERNEKIVLCKPQTYMNNSGFAVQSLTTYYNIPPADVWVVHDDIDLPLGSLRIRCGGSGAGHHGIESIIRALGTDAFWRFRVGIGHPKQRAESKEQKTKIHNVEEFVISPFTSDEQGKVKDVIADTTDAIACALQEGLERAGNKYNTK